MTAVEWFSDKTWRLKVQLENKEITVGEYGVTYVELLEQAKEMEKEQEKNLFVGTYISIKMEGNKLPYGMKYLALLQSITEEAEKFYDKTLKQRIK